MQGLMMDYPLTITHILDRARRYFAENEIVSRVPEGTHRYTWGELAARAERLAGALARLGVGKGARVGSVAWNGYRHMEAYFAVPCMGAVIHTINFRLAPDQLVHVINHAGDEILLVDASVFPALAQVRDQLTTVRHVVVMDDVGQGSPAGTLDYEELIADAPPSFAWPELDERAAAGMCYTSGTTGHPKGCVYSHRSQVLHTLAIGLKGCVGLSESDVAMLIVPMFHANAWGMPYAAAMSGMKLVLPGRFMQPSDLADVIAAERVTYIAGVPTIVAGIYQALQQAPRDISSLRLVTVGGAALPRVLLEGFERDFSVQVVQGWGMTEMSPVGSLAMLKRAMTELPSEDRTQARLKAGLPLPLVDVRIVDEAGRALPWDGEASGELQVRGPWVIGAYYDDPRNAEAFQDGWFRTGDVATIDRHGFIQIVDRSKDLVKSGGEWISSVDLENAIMGHPGVVEAAVIAVAHPKWTERPLACVVAKPGADLCRASIRAYLKGRVADWWLPDDVVTIDGIPKTSVGKYDKKVLRERFKDHVLPEVQ
jgi:fatty-acyl-CoA synthase